MREWRKIKNVDARIHYTGKVTLDSVRIGGYDVKDVLIKPQVSANGRLFHTFTVDGKVRKMCVHILVAKMFVKNPKKYDYVRHIDSDILNNHRDNLEWVESPPRYGARAKPPGLKLTKRNVSSIKNKIAKGQTLSSIADHYEVSISLISRIKSGERWS